MESSQQVLYDEAYGKIVELPGCPGVAVSMNAYVPPAERGKGKGQEQHKARLAYAKYLGYSLVVCTVSARNDVERHILHKNNWTLLQTFYCSLGEVCLYSKVVE